jgi:RNA polymerase sigma factor (sigma-70 family)
VIARTHPSSSSKETGKRLRRAIGRTDGTLERMAAPTQLDRQLRKLMQAAQAGDAGAYLDLLRAIAPRIGRIVVRQRGFAGTEAVEDLVQDVLLSFHAVRATYDPRRPFMPWLLAIVRNRLADGARRFGRIAAREVGVEDLEVTFAIHATNSNRDVYGDVEELHRAIQSLPVRERQAIELLKLREMSLKEASAASGVSVGALKVATHRAMAALRRVLRSES